MLRTDQIQVNIAKLLGVLEAAISKRLSTAGWREYMNGKEALKGLYT